MKRVISTVVCSLVLALAVTSFAQTPAGYLGLVCKPVPRDLARAAGLQAGEGAMVVEVVPNGPAAAAGIRVGDLLVSLDGQKVVDPEWLAAHVSGRHPGSAVTLEVVRQRLQLTFRAILGTPRPGPSRSDLPKVAGASVRS